MARLFYSDTIKILYHKDGTFGDKFVTQKIACKLQENR